MDRLLQLRVDVIASGTLRISTFMVDGFIDAGGF